MIINKFYLILKFGPQGVPIELIKYKLKRDFLFCSYVAEIIDDYGYKRYKQIFSCLTSKKNLISKKAVEQILYQADTNKDGHISLEEYINFVCFKKFNSKRYE